MVSQEVKESLAFLEGTPAAITRLAEGFSAAGLKSRLSDELFSLVEHVCHLRDIEVEGYNVRLRKFLDETRPIFEDIDGARLARERRYNEQDFRAAFSAFDGARRVSLSMLKGLPEGVWGRTASFEGAGEITLRRLASMMCEHDTAHRNEMAALREELTVGRAGAR